MYSRLAERDFNNYIITELEPHKHYTVSVKVMSGGKPSDEAQDNVVTMLDRKSEWKLTCPQYDGGCLTCCPLVDS